MTEVEVEVAIPGSLGLSEEQLKLLREKFKSDLVDVLKSTRPDVEQEIRPKVKNQVV
jgi:hypothetical protein